MKLHHRTDLALRVLIFLADADTATPQMIADAHGVSSSHIAKIMVTLSASGLTDAGRGRGRQTKLAKSTDDISVGEVVRLFEKNQLAECFRAPSACAISDACPLQVALSDAREAFMHVLDDVSLAQIQSPASAALVTLLRS